MSAAKRHRHAPRFTLVALMALAWGCSDDAGNTGPSVTVPDIEIEVSEPQPLQPVKEKFKVVGTLTNIGKLSPESLTATLRFKGYKEQIAKGASFEFTVDTEVLSEKGKPLAKDGKFCGSVSAFGTATSDSTVEGQGSKQVCVKVDNTLPVIEIFGPDANSTHIGKLIYSGRVSDSNLNGVQIKVDGKNVVEWCEKGTPGDCDKCAEKPGVQKCIGGSDTFEVIIDRAGLPSAKVQLFVGAADATGHQVTDARVVNVLKAPSFETARRDSAGKLVPGSEPGTLKEVIEHGNIEAFELGDFDGDEVIDAVMATTKGVYLRRGLTGADVGLKGEAAKAPIARFGNAEAVVAGKYTHLALLDLDQDGSLDVAAVGVPQGGKGGVTFLLARKGAAGEGGLRPVQSREVSATIKAIAVADLDNDGATDVVLGGLEDASALTVLYMKKAPTCPAKNKTDLKCAEAKWEELTAADFVVNSLAHKLLGSVTSLAIADFIADDSDPPLLDIAIGRDKPAISVCNNLGTALGACLDTNTSDFLFDMKDARFVTALHWNDDDGDKNIGSGDYPDLVVGTSGGIVRWVSGDHKGGFFFDIGDPNIQYKNYDFDAALKSMHVAPTGPNGADRLLVAYAGRTVVPLPVDPADHSDITQCFRSFVLGQAIDNVRAADLDGDDILDLVGVTAKQALSIAMGKGDGEYHAAAIHRVCGLLAIADPDPVAVSGVLDVAQFGARDLTGDDRDDLILVSGSAVATIPKNTEQGPRPQPAIYFGLYTGTANGLTRAVRTGEFGPYNTSGTMTDAGVGDKEAGGLNKTLPPVSGLAFGEFNSAAPADLVLAFDTSYVVGTEVKDSVGPEGNGDILECAKHEVLELMNILGDQGSDDKGNMAVQCKYFSLADSDKKFPLHGFNQGAYLDRMSLGIWIGNPAKPFGIGADAPPYKPTTIMPHFSQSAGIGIVDLAVGNFDNDSHSDVAVLLRQSSDDLQARVRLFKGLGKGRIGPTFYLEKGKGEVWPGLPAGCKSGDTRCIVSRYCSLNETNCTLLDVPKAELSLIPAPDPTGGQSLWLPVTYRVVAPDPRAIAAAPFCDDKVVSLFTLSNAKDGNVGSVTWLRKLAAGGVFAPKLSISIGENLAVFKPIDVNQDGCTDLLCGLKAKMGFTAGSTNAFAENAYFDVSKKTRTAVDTLDVNQDGVLDLVVVERETNSVAFWLGSSQDLGGGKKKFEFIEYPHPMFALLDSSTMQQADLNDDGCPDLAVQGKRGVAVYINTGCTVP